MGKKLICLIMSLALLVQGLPLLANASTSNDESSRQVSNESFPPVVQEESDVSVLYEIEDRRSEKEKHFYLSDGSFVAVSYPGAVHYPSEAGKWEDIDNTLTLDTEKGNTPNLLSAVYKAENGNEVKSFASKLYPNKTAVSIFGEDYTIGLSVLNTLISKEIQTEKMAGTDEDPADLEEVFGNDQGTPIPGGEPSERIGGREDSGTETDKDVPNPVEPIKEQAEQDLEMIGDDSPAADAKRTEENAEHDPLDAPTQENDSADDESRNVQSQTLGQEPASEEKQGPDTIQEENSDGDEYYRDTDLSEDDESRKEDGIAAIVYNPEDCSDEMGIKKGAENEAIGKTVKNSLAEQMMPKNYESAVKYENVWPSTDLRYCASGSNIKESIVVKEAQEEYKYDFLLELDGLTAVLQKGGSIELLDSQGALRYLIPAPYMTDANDDISYDVSYDIAKATTGFVLTVKADKGWIEAEKRVWPVTIDPTLVKVGSDFGNEFTATCLTQGTSSTGFGGESLYVGHDSYGRDIEVFFQFGSLPTIPENCDVVGGSLQMYHHTYSSVGMDQLFASLHEITSSRPSYYATNADWIRGMTWSTKPSYDGSIEAYAKLDEGTTRDYVSWDISRTVTKWYNSANLNRMLAMKAAGPVDYSSSEYAAAAFWMNINSRPLFMVYYRNSVGLIDYHTSQTAFAGRAGTAFIDDYSANLTLGNPILSSNSEAMPFTLTAYYNSPYREKYFTADSAMGIHTSNYSTLKLGVGWKLSIQQSVVQASVSTPDYSETQYVFTDADGTEHYFRYDSSSGSYKDEDGLSLTLNVSGDTITIRDEKNVRKVFYNGYLIEDIDRNDNTIYYVYNQSSSYNPSTFAASGSGWKPVASQSNRCTHVIQINNGSNVRLLICKLLYNSANRLTSIVDAKGKSYSFSYSTISGKDVLSYISFPDAERAYYQYNSSTLMLNKAFDGEACAGLEFAYVYKFGKWGVQSVHEYISQEGINGSQTVGAAWHSYAGKLQERQYRFYGIDHISETLDDVVSHYTFDLWGRTVNVVNYNTDRSQIIGTSAAGYTKNTDVSKKNNRMTGSAGAGTVGRNLLNNSGFEFYSSSDCGWTKYTDAAQANFALTDSLSGEGITVYPRTGNKLLKMYYKNSEVDQNGNGKTLKAYQRVYLQMGRSYVFSGYVNTAAMYEFGLNGGVFLAFETSAGSSRAVSRIINYKTTMTNEKGWTRLSVTYTPSSSGLYRVSANLRNASRLAAFDDIQLEQVPSVALDMPVDRSGSASSANLVQLGSVEYWNSSSPSVSFATNYWTYPTSGVSIGSVDSQNPDSPDKCFKMGGDPNDKLRAQQVVSINRPATTTFILSAWGCAKSVTDCTPVTDLVDDNTTYQKFFGVIAKLEYSDAQVEYHYVAFNPQVDAWQCASNYIVPKRSGSSLTIKSITVSLAYDYNVNTALFDNISLSEEAAQTYTYDSDGKLKKVTSSGGDTETFTYSGPDLTTFVHSGFGTFNYSYDSKHNMTSATNNGVTLSATYDSSGNNTKAKLQRTSSGPNLVSTASYLSNMDHPSSVTDVNGITTTLSYDALGRVSETTTPISTPNNTKTVSQRYIDGTGDRVSSTYISSQVALANQYEKGYLSEVSRKTFLDGTVQWQRYAMQNDSWGNTTQITVQKGTASNNSVPASEVAWNNGVILGNYTYDGATQLLAQYQMGNGLSVSYTYDLYGRLSKSSYGTCSEAFSYDSNGNLAESIVRDSGLNIVAEYTYEYDSLGRCIRSEQTGSSVTTARTSHGYDTSNRLISQIWDISGRSNTQNLSYDSDNGTLTTLGLGSGDTLEYTYDDIMRPWKKTLGSFYQNRVTYTSVAGEVSSNTTRSSLKPYDYTYYKGASYNTGVIGFRYMYDSAGNISQIKNPLASGQPTLYSFQYDLLGQMTQSTGPNGTETYTYDTAGNIRSRTLGSTTIQYGYDDARWGDLLTAYDGKKIAYEGQTFNESSNNVTDTPVSGNPISYYNGTRWKMQWQNGRQLASSTAGSTDVSYTYDKDGLRTSKTSNGITYSYVYLGGKLMWQGWNGNELFFYYDADGKPVEFLYYPNGGSAQKGYYYTNGQGDVVRIENAYGTVRATYTYDAWGRILTSSGSWATMNPLRYRGYCYDEETGFYYLQSRYYDPKIGRFINADTYASTGLGFLGSNMFAYCANNPCARRDPSGFMAIPFPVDFLSGAPTSDVGNAPRYREVPEIDLIEYLVRHEEGRGLNCYGYASGFTGDGNPGALGGITPAFYDVHSVAEGVLRDYSATGHHIRRINSATEKIYPNERKIALRVRTKKEPDEGKYDYHFMMQTSTGQWADKQGGLGGTNLYGLGLSPDTIPWNSGDRVRYYDSEIMYFAVIDWGF